MWIGFCDRCLLEKMNYELGGLSKERNWLIVI